MVIHQGVSSTARVQLDQLKVPPNCFKPKYVQNYILKWIGFHKSWTIESKTMNRNNLLPEILEKLFVLPLRVLWKWSQVTVCGCGDMGSSAGLSKLQMLFVAFMGQIPSSWLLKHSPARCWVFLISILFRGDQINFFLKIFLARN